jgi:hypothetical protein
VDNWSKKQDVGNCSQSIHRLSTSLSTAHPQLNKLKELTSFKLSTGLSTAPTTTTILKINIIIEVENYAL